MAGESPLRRSETRESSRPRLVLAPVVLTVLSVVLAVCTLGLMALLPGLARGLLSVALTGTWMLALVVTLALPVGMYLDTLRSPGAHEWVVDPADAAKRGAVAPVVLVALTVAGRALFGTAAGTLVALVAAETVATAFAVRYLRGRPAR